MDVSATLDRRRWRMFALHIDQSQVISAGGGGGGVGQEEACGVVSH